MSTACTTISRTQPSLSFNNIDRVEVLEGPQGTLFGRNATGGLIQVITKDPAQEPAGTLSLSAGNYKTYTENFYGTTGVTDHIATDLAAYYMDRKDGIGTNLLDGEPTLLRNEISLRNKWKYTGEDTKVTAIFDYSDVNTSTGLSRDLPPGSIGLFGTPSTNDPYNIRAYVPPKLENRSKGASVKVDHTFDGFDLVSISAYRRDLSYQQFDAVVTSAVPLGAYTLYSGRAATEEIQLVSNGSSKNKWITGIYLLDSKDGAALDVTGPLYTLSGLDANRFGGSILTKSYSAFAEYTRELTDKSHFTIGGRFTRDDRSVSGYNNDYLLPAGTPPIVATPVPNQSKSWQEPTWRLNYDYHVMDDVMLYVSYNRGFKSGNFDAVAPQNPAFNPEILDAYETGVKSELFDHHLRLNADAFFYHYKDLQQEILESFTVLTTNAARAQIKGLELQATAPLTESFTLDSGFSLVDGTYLQFDDATRYTPTGVGGNLPAQNYNASGRPIERTPKYSGNLGGTYTLTTDSGHYSASLRAAYKSGFPWEPDGRLYEKAHTLLNATVGWRAPSDRWGIHLTGRNLTNVVYAIDKESTATGDYLSPADPRTYDISLDMKF
jgi:iron complex outermembrane recepter protein